MVVSLEYTKPGAKFNEDPKRLIGRNPYLELPSGRCDWTTPVRSVRVDDGREICVRGRALTRTIFVPHEVLAIEGSGFCCLHAVCSLFLHSLEFTTMTGVCESETLARGALAAMKEEKS